MIHISSLEEGKKVLQPEPTLSKQHDGTFNEEDKMKFNKHYTNWLNLEYTIEKEMKQSYSIYLGQCNGNMKATLAEHKDFKTADKAKDLLTPHKILQSINLSYTTSEEPIVMMWKAKSDFVKIHQQHGQTVSNYY